VFILEVVTGFRLGLGGAQERFNLDPDLASYTKAIGRGFPISAIAGKERIMKYATPGEVLHGGTYNVNPMCLAASNATLDVLSENNGAVYSKIYKIGEQLLKGHEDAIRDTHTDAIVQGVGLFYSFILLN
jgi:glutamate-1-semialdehyde 2,1-aminomutase